MDTLVGLPYPINEELNGGRVQDVELMKGDVQTAFSQDPRSFLANTFVPRRQYNRQSMRRELSRNLEANTPVTPRHHSNRFLGPPPAFSRIPANLTLSYPYLRLSTKEYMNERRASAQCSLHWDTKSKRTKGSQDLLTIETDNRNRIEESGRKKRGLPLVIGIGDGSEKRDLLQSLFSALTGSLFVASHLRLLSPPSSPPLPFSQIPSPSPLISVHGGSYDPMRSVAQGVASILPPRGWS